VIAFGGRTHLCEPGELRHLCPGGHGDASHSFTSVTDIVLQYSTLLFAPLRILLVDHGTSMVRACVRALLVMELCLTFVIISFLLTGIYVVVV